MSLSWDSATGQLDLSTSDFEALVGLFEEGQTSTDFAQHLGAAGVMVDGSIVPGVVTLMDAVLAPVCRIDVGFVDARTRALHQLWLVPGSFTVFTDLGEGGQLGESSMHELWTALVDFTGLSPHRLRSQLAASAQPAVTVPEDVVADVGSTAVDARRTAVRSIADSLDKTNPVAEAIRSEEWRAWWVECTWPYLDGTLRSRGVAVLDTADGALLIQEGQLSPVTSTEIWKTLLSLTPTDDELVLNEVP